MDKKLIQCIEGYKKKRDMNHKREIQWLGKFFELLAYKEIYGNSDVPDARSGEFKILGHWVQRQRVMYTSKAIDPAREELLKMIGFNFRLIVEWDDMFKKLVQFKEEFGHTNVSNSLGKDKTLSKWVQWQRKLYGLNSLDPLKEELLKMVGFKFRLLFREDWDAMFNKLIKFKEEFGHLHVPKKEPHEYQYLRSWIRGQRKRFWNGVLEETRYKKLESIGVEMDRKLYVWDKQLALLADFKKKHGHLYVSPSLASRQLTNYVRTLRSRKNTLSEERIKMLDHLGFVWKPGSKMSSKNRERLNFPAWLKKYEELKAFKLLNGHCYVTKNDKKYGVLGRWVHRQRRNKKLSEEKVRLLDKLGFFEKKQSGASKGKINFSNNVLKNK